MPSPAEILSGLTRIAHDALFVAVAWHVALALFVGALIRGWRPSHRVVGLLAALPVASVSALAFAFGNPFNGATFALLGAALAVLAARADRQPIVLRVGWPAWLGGALVAFAWAYPHFLSGMSPLAYLVAAPVGLVPCPTLSLMLGLALLGVAPRGRAWPALVVAAAGLYALIGTLRLGVTIDLGLVVGALGLAIARWQDRAPRTLAHGT